MLLDVPADQEGTGAPRVPAWVAGLATALATAVALERLGLIGPDAVAVTAVVAGHGSLLVTALALSGARWRGPAAAVLALLAAAALLSRRSPWGALFYAAVPCALVWLARRGGFLPGLASAVMPRAVALGVAAGVFLGGHLLVSGALTFGYEISFAPGGAYLAAVAYDVGANIPSAECFLRGVVFERAQRRWSFATGVLVASGAAVTRYLLDPSLPHTVEIMAGGAFYTALLSATTCALFRWSGSLIPGAAASLTFFAAYRAVHAA